MNGENSFNKPPSIEELQAAQARNDEEKAAEARQREAEEQREGELREQAEEDIGPRGEILAELQMIQAEIDELRETRIDERIADSEKLRESQVAKEEELHKTQERFDQIADQLTEIQALMEGREEEDIAEEVKIAFNQVQEQKNHLEEVLQGLTRDLEMVEAESVSEVQTQRYQELLEKMDELNTQVADIEANPYVIERLFDEAKSEDDMRERVVREAMSGTYGDRGPKQTEIQSQVVQRFLTEEFDARGINQIEDPKEREEAMREFTQAVASGVGGGADSRHYQEYYTMGQNEKVGILLKNLVGKHGNMAGTEFFMKMASGDIEVGDYIRRHLGTINYLRANSSSSALGGRFVKDRWKEFDDKMYGYGLTSAEGEAIVDPEVEQATRDEMQAEFQRQVEEIQAWEKAVKEKEKAAKDKAKEQLTVEITEMEEEVRRLEDRSLAHDRATDKIRQLMGAYGFEDETRAKEMFEQVSNEVSDLESQRTKAEEELKKLGVFAFRKKRELRDEVARIDSQISNKQPKKDDLEEALAVYEDRRDYKGGELFDAKMKLQGKKNQLAALSKA